MPCLTRMGGRGSGGQVKAAVKGSRHWGAVVGTYGGEESVETQIEGIFEAVAAKRAKDARNSNRSGASARRRNEKTERKQRVGYLYVHVDALGRLIKIGLALANNGQRGRGAGTATFWPSGLGRMTVRVELGQCTEAAAAVRLRCYETLVRAVLHKHLVHLRREVRPARPDRDPPPSPLASCCQCGGAGPDHSGAPGVQVVHLYDGDSGECLVSPPAVHPLALPTRSPACPEPEPEQSSLGTP